LDTKRFLFVQERLPRILQNVVMFVCLGHFGFPAPAPSKGPPAAMVILLTDLFRKIGKSGRTSNASRRFVPHAQGENLRPLGPNVGELRPFIETGISLSTVGFEELSSSRATLRGDDVANPLGSILKLTSTMTNQGGVVGPTVPICYSSREPPFLFVLKKRSFLSRWSVAGEARRNATAAAEEEEAALASIATRILSSPACRRRRGRQFNNNSQPQQHDGTPRVHRPSSSAAQSLSSLSVNSQISALRRPGPVVFARDGVFPWIYPFSQQNHTLRAKLLREHKQIMAHLERSQKEFERAEREAREIELDNIELADLLAAAARAKSTMRQQIGYLHHDEEEADASIGSNSNSMYREAQQLENLYLERIGIIEAAIKNHSLQHIREAYLPPKQ
jgi:hypothetical protein